MARNANRILVAVTITLAVIALTIGAAAGATASPTASMSEDTQDPESTDGGTTNETDDGSGGDETNGDDSGEEADQEAVFEIQDVETNSPIREGETVTVTMDLQNTGDLDGTKEVWFQLDKWRKAETEVTLAPGERRSVQLEWVSELGDDKEWELEAETPDDLVKQQYTIRDSSSERSSNGGGSESSGGVFELSDVETNAPMDANETLTFTVNVTNTGDTVAQKRVWFELDDRPTNQTTVILNPRQTQTVELSHDMSEDDAGTWNTTVYTPDDTEPVTVEVAELMPAYAIESVETNAPVAAGETMNTTVNVTNTGNVAGNESVRFELEGQSIDRANLELAVNESRNVTLTYQSDRDAVGTWNVSVLTAADRHNETITLTEPSTSAESSDTTSSESESSTTTSEDDSSTSTSEESSSTSTSEEDSTSSSEESSTVGVEGSPLDAGPVGAGAAFVLVLTTGALAFRQFG